MFADMEEMNEYWVKLHDIYFVLLPWNAKFLFGQMCCGSQHKIAQLGKNKSNQDCNV